MLAMPVAGWDDALFADSDRTPTFGDQMLGGQIGLQWVFIGRFCNRSSPTAPPQTGLKIAIAQLRLGKSYQQAA